ncbi:hypothetical protein PVMG_05968 [Plasmodium vivax Mauritania I]|uniref:Variable surface protein Vir18 n=1 Tax=Plasmodium vivax Mauritania I TaxID=1035515 RepID=A0A0J9TJ30_PLAVI|nr:hypothetical protein PVMG_05968 [Plasmodium vivax Mauritania I]
MNSWFGRYNIRSNPYSKYHSAPCMNNYANIKRDIIQKIEDFEKTTHDNFYKQWDQLNKYIIERDNELSDCYKKRFVKNKLNDDEAIKNFTKRCNAKRECNNGTSPAKKPPIIKPNTQRICKDRDSCKSKTPGRVDFKSQSKLIPGPTDSKSLEIKNPKEQVQNQADLQKLRQESVLSQSQSGSTPSGSSAGTNDKTSQEIVNHHSTTTAVVEAQAGPLNSSYPSGISELGSPPCDHSSQRISAETSDLTCTSRGKILDTIGIQTKQHSGKTLEDNNPQTQDSAGNVIAEKTSSDKDISSEIAHNLSPAESTSDSVQRAEVDPLPTATVGGSTDTVFSDSGKTGSEAVSSASLASASRDVGNNGVTYDAISSVFKAPDGEIKIDKVSHDHTHDSEGLCIEGKCNEAQNAEITSDNNNDILGTLTHVFEVIQENKDNMIKASAPMGIVLLLTLIFKYTPLWRVLTKKNGKKGAGIIEELNSVVQEPSIMDDERSIPFSYGAFEYSAFDQNVY